MRSSSIKTVVVTLSLVATVIATTPAEARPAPAPRNTVNAPADEPAARFTAAWTRLANALRRLGRTITMGLPAIPLPGADNGTTTSTASPTSGD